MAKPISCLIISLSPSRKQERWQRQQIQSHQKRRSMLSSSRSQKNNAKEKPYRAGQLLARPATLFSLGFSCPLGFSGSPPRKRRIERRSSAGFSFRSSKK